MESFLPHLAGRRVLLHEDNETVCHILTGLTSRPPEMMHELRRLWCLLDTHMASIDRRALYPLDPAREAVDARYRLSDGAWRRENKWRNPPWQMLPKLRQSGAPATVVAPS
eukprot:jgi/Tetstr1/447025/TSEL_034483.t1